MVELTRALAAAHGVDVPAVVCAWEALEDQGWRDVFDVVFCVGNSIVHAGPPARRRAALAAMAHVLRDGGLLVVTSRNWELVRNRGSGIRVADRLIERDGGRGLVIYDWTVPEDAEQALCVDVAVARIAADGAVTTNAERLECWPFTHEQLDADLRAAGLTPQWSTYRAGAERYLVTARRRAVRSTGAGSATG
jgi:SAM-dependent methyltransferase